MPLIKITDTNLGEVLKTAVQTLKEGGIVAYPTETFYGLGVKYDMEPSLSRLCMIKQRPKGKAMPIIIGSRLQLELVAASVNPTAESLIKRFWPGPLSLIIPARGSVSEFITAGTRKIAVRIPGESFALKLARHAGFPITSTSANPSGLLPALNAESVERYFHNDIDLIVDGGTTPGGLPSTIVDTEGNRIGILRDGAVNRDLIMAPAQ